MPSNTSSAQTRRRPPDAGPPRAPVAPAEPGTPLPGWLARAWGGAGVLAVVVALCAAGSAALGATLPVAPHRATGAALIAGAVVGFLAGAIFVLHPARRAEEQRARLVATLRALSRHNRDRHFSAILEAGARTELAEVALAAHDALVSAHRDRLEAATLRREMDHRVEQSTRAAVAQLARLTHTDELTSLLNRRGFDHALRQVWNETAPSGEEVSLLAIDLDLFKQLNDSCGHEKGDQALRAAGEVFRAHLREGDFAARTGGDELFILLRGVGPNAAAGVAQRFMSLYATHPAGVGLPVPWPTMSVGIAAASAHGAADPEDLKRKADAALYDAKNAGRNQCRMYDPAADPHRALKASIRPPRGRSAA